MEPRLVSADTYWFFFTPFVSSALQDSTLLSQFIICSSILISGFLLIALVKWASPSGCAWSSDRRCSIPGPRGWPIIGSLFQMHGLAHRKLAQMAKDYNAKSLMAFSLGCSRVVIASKPETARQLLNSPNFANRPVKESAHMLLFSRAIGFAPYGDYWRNLRRIAASYMFSPRRISAQEALRQSQTSQLIIQVAAAARNNTGGMVHIRPFLQRCSLNNIMGSVFGRTYEFGSGCSEANQLEEMVREGFDLLGASNWADHLPALKSFDPQGIIFRCQKLAPKVTAFVKSIIDEHRAKFPNGRKDDSGADFVDVLLTLSSNEQLQDEDMVAVLWEMIFRGTDTTAILTEWVLAELVLHPEIQSRVQSELDHVVGAMRPVQDVDIAKLPYLQAVVKETLRMHPPGPLLSWARLSTHDCMLDGHFIPAGTTAMVNMWMITHDESIWANPEVFRPERFMEEEVDIKGGDLRLAPFGAGRRVCPGRALGLATVHLWLARLFQHFCWLPCQDVAPIDLKECLKLSCEMATPLLVRPVPRPNMPPIHPRDVNKASL